MELKRSNGVKSKEFMDFHDGVERRRSKRVTYPFEVWYKDRNKNDQGFKHAYGKDISEHGLLFETYEVFSPCTILEIKLESPISGGGSFNILAEVVRTVEARRQWLYNIGVSFCKIDPDCREFLKEYISKGLDKLEHEREIISVR